MISYAALALLAFTIASFFLSRSKAVSSVNGRVANLHSLPSYHGMYSLLWVAIVGFGVLIIGNLLAIQYVDYSLRSSLPDAVLKLPELERNFLVDQAKALAEGRLVIDSGTSEMKAIRDSLSAKYVELSTFREIGISVLAILGALIAFVLTYSAATETGRARNKSEGIIYVILACCAGIAILTTIGILGSLIGETVKFFSHVSIHKFLFGTQWSPLSGVFEGKVDENTVGAVPLFAGTFMIAFIAMFVSVPIGLMAAIYLSEYASPIVRKMAKPVLEILAGIPTVVYGFFAAITVAPMIRGFGESYGLSVASESALTAGLVMGIMIIPFISSLSDDVINAVPRALRDGSFGVGATKAETISKVVLPAALPGVVSAILLGFSRAVGETMIVVMAAGQGANLTWNPLEAMTTVTVQIVALITGDTEADTAAGPAFALGFTLLVTTLIFNIIALRIVQKYRQKYD